MATPESKVKEKVRALLKKYGSYWHMPVQNGMGRPALDFHVCDMGRYAAIETKAKGKKPTDRQLATAAEVEAAGGRTFFIDGDTSELEEWLQEARSKDDARYDRFGDDEH